MGCTDYCKTVAISVKGVECTRLIIYFALDIYIVDSLSEIFYKNRINRAFTVTLSHLCHSRKYLQ